MTSTGLIINSKSLKFLYSAVCDSNLNPGQQSGCPCNHPQYTVECAILVGVATKAFVEWTWVAKTVKTCEFSPQAMWNWA